MPTRKERRFLPRPERRGLRAGYWMKRSALVITLFFALIAFACGFGGGTAYFNVTQPANPGSNATVLFEVQHGELPSDIGPRLQDAGLIRNATVFTYYTKFIRKFVLKEGVFTLSPGYTMDKIISTLATATPIPQVKVTIQPGLRILEYPLLTQEVKDGPLVPRFHNLPKFSAENFIKIATTGKYLDGTDVSKSYWFAAPLHKDAKAALEGYLYPDTYFFNKTDDETAVINRMLDAFGMMLCPGPNDNPGAYFNDATACKAHMAKVGADPKTDILTVAKAKFSTTDDVEAIYKALTLSSMVVREASSRGNYVDRVQIADILYRRLLASQGKLATPAGDPNTGNYHCIDDDSTSWYAYFSDHMPTDGNYWSTNVGLPKTTAPDSPYNTYTHCTDLPPGPIAAPGATAPDNGTPGVPFFYAATDPNLGTITKAFFYLHDGCLNPHIYVATTYAQQQANIRTYNGKCPTGN
jgi:cell division protein YceG involved in septum cleavage